MSLMRLSDMSSPDENGSSSAGTASATGSAASAGTSESAPAPAASTVPQWRGRGHDDIATQVLSAVPDNTVSDTRAATERTGQGASSGYARVVGSRSFLIVTEVILTIAVLLGTYVFWELVWSNVQSDRAQAQASDQLRDAWSLGEDTPASVGGATGNEFDAFAYLHIPALGDDWSRAMMTDTTESALAAGPGHYSGSQAAGEVGNFAVAGHRDGQGAPFHDLDVLTTCTPIVVETATSWYVYRVLPVDATGQNWIDQTTDCLGYDRAAQLVSDPQYADLAGMHITDPSDVAVVAPVPGFNQTPVQDANAALLTLTTCHPVYSNAERLIVHAALEESIDKSNRDEHWQPEVVSS